MRKEGLTRCPGRTNYRGCRLVVYYAQIFNSVRILLSYRACPRIYYSV
jgi:hypothetical protein